MRNTTVHNASPIESAVVRSILKWLNEQPGCYARKTTGGPHSAQWPDIVGCFQGVMLALEVKRPNNEKSQATPMQRIEIEKWRQCGAVAGVVRSVDDVKQLLRTRIDSI